MSQVTYSVPVIGFFLNGRRLWQAALLVAILVCVAQPSWGQAAAAPEQQANPSLAESLKRADTGKTQLHIFYVHGMGINAPKPKAAPQDFEVSQEFRTSFCKLIHCTTRMGEFEGRDYANEADFDPTAAPPQLLYFGEYLWKQSATNDDWHAAAPFVDHYKLVRKNGTIIYLHEINWWPLVLSAKCRQIVALEAALVGPDAKHIETCSAKTVQDSNHEGRFKSYAWINDVQQRDPSWPEPAVINRELKHDILDWGFADALLAVGPMHKYLIEGIREIVMDSFTPASNQEFVVVSHSLGSYLMFSALDLEGDPQAAMHPDWNDKFDKVLSQTSHAYFMANQIRLLELANLDDVKNGNLIAHLQNWSDSRSRAQQPPPQIVAWSDPDDLLTWQVPDPDQNVTGANVKHVTVTNRPAMNAWRWFWLLENPEDAHLKYDQNKRVVRAMVPKSNPRPTQEVNGTN